MLTSFEDRIVDAFGGRTLKEVAERLDVNYHTLRNWAKETRDIPPAELKKIAILTNVSLNWLLLGEGEKFANQRKEFNLERSIERHHAWRPVLEEWFEFEGKEMPEFEGASLMHGWGGLPRDMKVLALVDLKRILDRHLDNN